MLTYSPDGATSSELLPGVLEPHDLLLNDEGLLLVSSGTNEVVRLGLGGQVSTFWRADGEGNAWHLNCLTGSGGRLFVSAFGRFKRHDEWRAHKADGSGVVHDLGSGEDFISGLCCPHHPRIIGGEMVVCNSAKQELLAFDLTTMRQTRKCHLEGWTRGLAFDDDHLFVGVSSPRDFPGEAALAHVAVLDRLSWRVEGRIELPCSEIYDVFLVSTGNKNLPVWWRHRMATE